MWRLVPVTVRLERVARCRCGTVVRHSPPPADWFDCWPPYFCRVIRTLRRPDSVVRPAMNDTLSLGRQCTVMALDCFERLFFLTLVQPRCCAKGDNSASGSGSVRRLFPVDVRRLVLCINQHCTALEGSSGLRRRGDFADQIVL